MALTNIPFSDGSSNKTLTSNSAIQYDATNNNLLASSPSSTFGVGVGGSAILGGDSHAISAGTRHVIIGGNGNSISGAGSESSGVYSGNANVISSTGVWNGIFAGNGNTISGAGNQSGIVGSAASLISASGNDNAIAGAFGGQITGTSANSMIASGVTSTIVDSTSSLVAGTACSANGANFITALGHSAVSTAQGTFVWCDSAIGTSTLNTANSAAFYATNGVVISNTANAQPSTSALLELTSTTKTFLMPRMTTAQKNAISPVFAGNEVFDLNLVKPCYWDGAAWNTVPNLNTFTTTMTFNGVWASPQVVNVWFERINNTVTIQFGIVQDTATIVSVITSDFSTPIPAQFRPLLTQTLSMSVIENSANVAGSVQIGSAGGMIIGIDYADPITGRVFQLSPFGNTGTAGFPIQSISYLVGA